ncbi:MAG: hypothetical protein ACXWJ4_08405, partial [Methyloceanibacter sp.]
MGSGKGDRLLRMTEKPKSFPPVELLFKRPRSIASGVPEGLDAFLLGELARVAARSDGARPILHIARDGQRLAMFEDALAFFAPEVRRL